jgi:hypothetical protein
MHHHELNTAAVLFTTANVVIAVGYLAVPFLVLRYLPLTRTVLVWGAIFFLGCSGTHVGMALLMHGDPGLFWTLEHLVQAVGTWGFIITFTRMLRRADSQRRRGGRGKA